MVKCIYKYIKNIIFHTKKQYFYIREMKMKMTEDLPKMKTLVLLFVAFHEENTAVLWCHLKTSK